MVVNYVGRYSEWKFDVYANLEERQETLKCYADCRIFTVTSPSEMTVDRA